MKSYLQLFLSNIQKRDQLSGKSLVVAFTASQPKEGVSFVTESFAVELAKRTQKRVLIADAADLQEMDIFLYSRVSECCYRTNLPNLYVLSGEEEIAAEAENRHGQQLQLRTSNYERALSNLQTLRYGFDFILIDCSALSVSENAALIAPAADGVVLVVEADRTRRQQVQNALQTLETANGNLLGCVLNKRAYPIPDWVYRRL